MRNPDYEYTDTILKIFGHDVNVPPSKRNGPPGVAPHIPGWGNWFPLAENPEAENPSGSEYTVGYGLFRLWVYASKSSLYEGNISVTAPLPKGRSF